jgi:nucleotide-binding universal stress UspA family protein
MAYKDILAYVGLAEDVEPAIKLAVHFAQQWQARLDGVHIIALPEVQMMIETPIPGEALAQELERRREQAQAIKFAAVKLAGQYGADLEWRQEEGFIDPLLIRHARYADVTIMANDGATNHSRIGEVMLASGRPVLLAPRGGWTRPIGTHVALGWDATREAARALDSAMPLLESAQKVSVIRIRPQIEEALVDDIDIGRHLARHGIKVELIDEAAPGLSVGAGLISATSRVGADLLVMGGYGHSRLRQFVFGGTTRDVMEMAAIPVWMAH